MRFIPILAAMLLALPALAGPASDRIFSTAALDLVKTGQQVIYTHIREGNAGEELQLLPDGEIRIRVQNDAEQKREAVVTMGPIGKLKPVSIWPASSGNPILPIFLESALRAMSRTTGGSSFYIRNRIKEALGAGGQMNTVTLDVAGKQVTGTEIVFPLFENDKNRDRMGAFKDMSLTFVVSDQTPGDISRFTAQTPEDANGIAYREEIRFSELTKAEE